MRYLLFPGRHLANTRFQEEYLKRVRRSGAFEEIIFAVTSANRQNSRYNPIPFHVRAIGVDRFGQSLRTALGVQCRILGIPNYPPSDVFAKRLLREIEEQTEHKLVLTPQNTAVLCSTPAVSAVYAKLGFQILPCEAAESEANRPRTPMQLVAHVADLGSAWAHDESLKRDLHPATYSLWNDFPEVPERIARLYHDPLLTQEGDLTATRNYATYGTAMSNAAAMDFKYADIKDALIEGKIVDEGCADAALLVRIARDFPDSDLMGIEITGEFLAQCQERQRRGEFGGAFVHFHQRNLMEEIFEPNSVDTTICNSTTHELWSYGNGAKTLLPYLERKFKQTRRGGRLVVRDVTGPENKVREVLLWCADTDGANADIFRVCASPAELAAHLNNLSTAARFKRFAQDFLAAERTAGQRGPEHEVLYREVQLDGRAYFSVRLKDAAEFLAKKDYTDNWESELHEEFTFWSYSEWKDALRQVGFSVLEYPEEPQKGSRNYLNPWIVENRYKGRVSLFRQTDAGLTPLEFPPTSVVLVGEKR